MITITEMAAKKILESVQEAAGTGDGLRVRVVGGGCPGLQCGDVESRTEGIRDEIESRFDNVRKQREVFEKQAGAMRKQAVEGWDKLEGFFEERVTRVLSRVGIPTRDDIDRLNRRMQELSRTVANWIRAASPRPGKQRPRR